MAPAHAGELTPDGDYYRTLWHEIGHYLGADATADGRTLTVALADDHDLLEEMKADLVSLFVADALRARGYYDDAGLRSVQAAGRSGCSSARSAMRASRPRARSCRPCSRAWKPS